MFSAGNRLAQSSGANHGYDVRAFAAGRSSIRSSISRPLARNSLIHSPYGSWKSTDSSSHFRIP